jgi:hypothetical protein
MGRDSKGWIDLMVELAERCTVGPYLLTKALEPCAFADRFLALHRDDQSSHVAYQFHVRGGSRAQRRLETAIAACADLHHEHLLSVEDAAPGPLDDSGGTWAVCPFTGDIDGVRTLGKLLREKSGQMHAFEAERAIVQVLEAMAFAHGGGGADGRGRVVHGPITMDEILVDRHGCLLIEFYGLGRAVSGQGAANGSEAEAIRDEVRSVVELGYQLVTGLRAEAPMIPAGRLVKKLNPHMDRWLATGLDPSGGFDSAAQALAHLPCHLGDGLDETEIPCGWGAWGALGGGVRGVLSRLRSAR